MTTRRQRLILLGPGGESLAEIAADDVSAQTLGVTTAVSSWHEVEVELTGGDRQLLEAADELLRRDGLRPAGRSAKLERALGGQLPTPVHQAPLTSSSTAGQVVLAYLRTHAERLKSLDPMVRRDEPDAVHQMRVATRRLRSTLRSFGQVIRRDRTQRLATELKWLGTVLGEARDREVLAGHLQSGLRATQGELVIGPVQAHVQSHFASVRADARAALLGALDSQRYFSSLLGELDKLMAEPPLTQQAARCRLLMSSRLRRGALTGRYVGACAMRGGRHPARPGTWPCIRRAKRLSVPVTPARQWPRRSARKPAGSPSR